MKGIPKQLGNTIAKVIASWFCIGYVPRMPGTAGSFVGMMMWWLLPEASLLVRVIALVVLFLLGVWVSNIVEINGAGNDPSWIVIDEVVGIGIAILFLQKSLYVYFVAFFMFRFFDIIKPFPVGYVEKKLPRGWGVMLDDVVAGLMAWGVMFVLLWALSYLF